jgi:hypothetical protein
MFPLTNSIEQGLFFFLRSLKFVGFVALAAVASKIPTFRDITLCSPVKSTDVSEEYVASISLVKD